MPRAQAQMLSVDDLHDLVAVRFDETQNSLANHKKNSVALYKIHVQAASIIQSGSPIGEEAFEQVFLDMLARTLAVKQGPCPDRVVKFVAGYIKFINEKVSADEDQNNASTSKSDDSDDTLAARFTSTLLEWLLDGFRAKSKVVRQRAVTIVGEMIAHLGEIDAGTYDALKTNLVERIGDKEASVRAQTVTALAKLIGTEDPDEVADGQKTVLELLVDMLSLDPAPEVRRAILVNLPLTSDTLNPILQRARDTDSQTRKAVYASVFQTKLNHPRLLSIAQREQLVKTGLGDREANVLAVVNKLLGSWFDLVLAESDDANEELPWEGDDSGIMKAFLRFLGLFDVVGPGEEIASDAILALFSSRPQTAEIFVFTEAYWKNLTPESAVLARVFLEHASKLNDENLLEISALPVVTAFAFYVQESYNDLVHILHETTILVEPDEETEEELAQRELILGELLRMAVKLDFGDEIGRRKMFAVVKDMLAHPQLPPGLIDRSLDVLKELMPSERELIRVVVEIIIDLRDGQEEEPEGEDDTRSEASQSGARRGRSMRRAKDIQDMLPEERAEADLTDLRCLAVCISMLQRVHSSFEDNSTLEGVLTDLIIPTVKRKELALRERGLVALGLCCLIAKNMALSSLQLFLSQVQSSPTELKVKVLQVVFDLLIMYDQEFLQRTDEMPQQIIAFLLQILETEESDAIQSVVVIGISKLVLSGLITDTAVLTSLALTFISPSTSTNVELRQCLSYFFPVYCYSSAENQRRLQSIFISALDLASRLYDLLEDDQHMITPYQFGLLMIEWANPANLAPSVSHYHEIHAEIAVDILTSLFDTEKSSEDQKMFAQLLGQLHVENDVDSRVLLKLDILLENLDEQRPVENAAAEKLIHRFRDRFWKQFGTRLEAIDPRQFTDEEFTKLYESIGADPPDPEAEPLKRVRAPHEIPQRVQTPTNGEQGDDPPKTPPPLVPKFTPMKKGAKRQTRPASKTAASPTRKKRNQGKAPERRTKRRTEDSSDEDEVAATLITEAPRRSARTPHKKQMAYAEESETEQSVEEVVPVQKTRRQTRARQASESSDEFAYSDG